MKWSWRIGRIAGIDVYVHATFLLLLVWVGVSHYLPRHSLSQAAGGLLFILALFGIIVLHELGHALTARRYGIRTRDITLLPIGGVARLEKMPDDPFQELLVALAGPAVNVALAAGLWLVTSPFDQIENLGRADLSAIGFLERLFWINVGLVVFNLLPAFPMDGGRVLRSLLALRLDYVRATEIAAGVGQAMALLFGLIGLLGNPMLLFIALFVWVGAAQEASMVQMRSAIGGIPVSRAMITDYKTLSPRDPIASAINHIIAGFQQDFPVVDDGQVVGVLTRSDLLAALSQRGEATPVGDVMQRQFEFAEPGEMLEGVFSRLQTCNCHSLPVVHGNRLVGLMTMENLGEFLMIQAALAGGRR